MDQLSEKEQTMIKVQTYILRYMFNSEFEKINQALELKDKKIKQLNEKCDRLESRVFSLEDQVEELSQYGRRETIVLSGRDAIPAEQTGENTTDIMSVILIEGS